MDLAHTELADYCLTQCQCLLDCADKLDSGEFISGRKPGLLGSV
jgi:hypothetical protein